MSVMSSLEGAIMTGVAGTVDWATVTQLDYLNSQARQEKEHLQELLEGRLVQLQCTPVSGFLFYACSHSKSDCKEPDRALSLGCYAPFRQFSFKSEGHWCRVQRGDMWGCTRGIIVRAYWGWMVEIVRRTSGRVAHKSTGRVASPDEV
jgi:Zn-finger protein